MKRQQNSKRERKRRFCADCGAELVPDGWCDHCREARRGPVDHTAYCGGGVRKLNLPADFNER